MKLFIFKATLVAALSSWMISPAQAEGRRAESESLQKKQKAEKEPFDWETVRPKKLSNDKDIDEYILACDTVWSEIRTYKDSIPFYSLDTFYCPTEKIMLVQLRDKDGNKKNIGRTILQSTSIFLAATNLSLNMVRINTLAVKATTALANKPLLLFSYGKCLKAAPIITKIAVEEGKAIAAAKKEQTRQLKELYDGKLDDSTSETYRLPYEGEVPTDAEIVDNLENFDFGSLEEEDEISEEEMKKIEEELGLS
jgi:hypothetical protein